MDAIANLHVEYSFLIWLQGWETFWRKNYLELEKRCSKLVELTLDGTPITDASLDLLALHFKYLSSISSKGCTKVDFELLSAMPLILFFIDDYKILVLLHHELASSLLHAQLLLEKKNY